jgi:SWI/SNF-related matrix-associated actin-dependent regulator 1 of chromatin subfamily A
MNANDIEKLARWSEPKEVQTKFGPRLMRKAAVTPEFSSAWKTNKEGLKDAGASFSKNQNGSWELVWWQEIPEELKKARAESIEASRATAADIDLPKPEGLDYRPFQKAGIRYALDRDGVLIADEMGLGKTVEAIGVINADPSIKTGIIVCPKSLKLNWARELERWLTRPLTVGIANGSLPETDLIIINYEGLVKFQKELSSRHFDISVIDECHYIKNSKALRSKAVKAIKSRRKVRMTGTPIVNRPAELYNIIEDLGGSWGSFMTFAKRYCDAHQTRYGWDFTGSSNLDELQKRLRETVMVRRLKSEVLTELPRKIRQIIEVTADDSIQKRAVEAEKAYEEQSEQRLAALHAEVELSKAESEESYKAAVARLRDAMQVDFTEMSKLRHETALAKVPAVIDHVKNALEDNDNKVIIAAHHHDVIDELMEGLAEFNPVKLTGETKEADRQAAVDRFQNDPDCRVFIGSITAAGVGITLTASSHVIFAELDWTPGNITQMEDRAHRIGQTDTVLVQHIVLADSLDARMAKMLVEKQEIIDSALDDHHPARYEVVYEPKVKAATASESVEKIEKEAENLTEEQIADIHAKLRYLAALDRDYAANRNGMGFNKIDSAIGHSLAERSFLTPKQAALGMKLIQKYRKQLEVFQSA